MSDATDNCSTIHHRSKENMSFLYSVLERNALKKKKGNSDRGYFDKGGLNVGVDGITYNKKNEGVNNLRIISQRAMTREVVTGKYKIAVK